MWHGQLSSKHFCASYICHCKICYGKGNNNLYIDDKDDHVNSYRNTNDSCISSNGNNNIA